MNRDHQSQRGLFRYGPRPPRYRLPSNGHTRREKRRPGVVTAVANETRIYKSRAFFRLTSSAANTERYAGQPDRFSRRETFLPTARVNERVCDPRQQYGQTRSGIRRTENKTSIFGTK